MCGIFGVIGESKELLRSFDTLAHHAMQRGRDSAGIISFRDRYQITRADFKLTSLLSKVQLSGATLALGHSRLITNGNNDNQPVIRDGVVVLHNGIVVNVDEVAARNAIELRQEIDTEIIAALFALKLSGGYALEQIPEMVMSECEGIIAAAVAIPSLGKLVLFSNNGSLYFGRNDQVACFSSERFPLTALGLQEIEQIRATPRIIDIPRQDEIPPAGVKDYSQERRQLVAAFVSTHEEEALLFDYLPELHRCSKCLLPDTMPFIDFDERGVCNYCNNWEIRNEPKPKSQLLDLVEPYRRTGDAADCLVPFSGGRDSCYGLHLIVKELGLKPITYTYDWGMLTDLGRRNISRVSAKLGVENIIVAADIQKKRENIAKNLKAWLKSPDLGMVNIFTAGDKHFFQHIETVKRQTGVALNLWSFNPLEVTHFKAGFLGEPPDFYTRRVYSHNVSKQFHYQYLRLKAMLRNPAYFNTSIWDTLSGEYYRSFTEKRDYYHVFDYWRWDEDLIGKTLIEEYDWELAPDTRATWRIGDGTAAFYNYIYHTVAGFSEHDTFRSNQIREGEITREEALVKVAEENRPRYQNIRWYLDILGFDFRSVIQTINAIPKTWKSNGVR
jgi:glucosamine--fructose-6-phosphate aminotransferase (isomerizing)